MMKFFDLQHPFFAPLWVRLLVTGICFGWALLELSHGFLGWAAIFAAMGALCVWNFFVTWNADLVAKRKTPEK